MTTSEPELRALATEELAAWVRIRHASYGAPRDPDDAGAHETLATRLAYTRGAFVAGRLAAVATWWPFQIFFAGRRVAATGLAGVATAPWARRQGLVRRLVASGLAEARDANVAWALEHPFQPAFYARMGFRTVAAGAALKAPIALWPAERTAVDAHDVPLHDPEVIAIRRSFAQRYSFALDRDAAMPGIPANDRWSRVVEEPDDAAKPIVWRVDGGYLIAATRGYGAEGTLDVLDVAWRDPEGRGRVLALPHAWAGQVASVRIDLPDDDPVALDLTGEHRSKRTLPQARLVDLAAALAPLRREGTDPVAGVLQLRDDFTPWLNGRFRIELGPDGCRVTPTGDAANGSITAPALAALLALVPYATLRESGEAEGDGRLPAALAAAAASYPPFLGTCDYF